MRNCFKLQGENAAIHSITFALNNKVLAVGTGKNIFEEFLAYQFNYEVSIKYTVATSWDIQN
jgi:hypothetical protein